MSASDASTRVARHQVTLEAEGLLRTSSAISTAISRNKANRLSIYTPLSNTKDLQHMAQDRICRRYDSVYTFRVLTVLMSGYSERIVIRSWYSVLPRMDSVYTFV